MTAGDHARHEPGAQVDDRCDVDLDDVEFGVRVGPVLRTHHGQTGVVHQGVDLQAQCGHPAGQRRALRGPGKIGRHNDSTLTEFGGELGQPVGAPGHQHHMVAAAVEFAGDLGADPRGCAGHQGG